jgi:hypothetical protein
VPIVFKSGRLTLLDAYGSVQASNRIGLGVNEPDMNSTHHSYTRHMANFTICKLLTVLVRRVRIWEFRYLSDDKDVEPGLFVMTPYNLRTFRTTQRLLFFIGKETTRMLDYHNPGMTFVFEFMFTRNRNKC